MERGILRAGAQGSGGTSVAQAETALREANASVEEARRSRRLLRDEADRAQEAVDAAR
jgi:hypothetical protein